MFSDFPSLHPLIVHFPIVLILLAALFQALVTWKNWQQIRWATLFIMAGAFLSALAAGTVFHAMPSDDAPKAAMEIYRSHDQYAQYTIWMSGITLLLKGIGDFLKIHRRTYDGVVLVAAVLAAIFLSVTGHHGARLVHVAGVGPMGRYLMKDHHGKVHSGDMKDMHDMEKEDGQGTSTNHSMSKMDTMKGMENMHTTKALDNKGEAAGMDHMEGMHGMDRKKDMDQMDMPGMDMKNNRMDAFRFEDNNPALKKLKSESKE